MALNIVTADISALRKAAYMGRARSQEMIDLISAIQSLKQNQAKALVREPNETMGTLRSRLGYAARAADVKLRTVSDENRLMFGLKRTGGGTVQQREGAVERRAAVRECALNLAQSGQSVVSADDVLQALSDDGVTFDVARPATMVGAVLRSMSEFDRVGKNEFRYKAE